MQPQTAAIVASAADFMWSRPLATSVEAFTTNHAALFAEPPANGEHRLEWTQAHRDFQDLFEHQLEQFVSTQSFSQEEFIAACQDALDHGGKGSKGTSPIMDPAGFSAWIVETVLMSATYEYFVEAMGRAAAAAPKRRPPLEPEPEPEGTELQTMQSAGSSAADNGGTDPVRALQQVDAAYDSLAAKAAALESAETQLGACVTMAILLACSPFFPQQLDLSFHLQISFAI
jgi:hypothetical protein